MVDEHARDHPARSTVLVVEDDDAIRNVLIGALEAKCQPIGARDATEALRILASGEPQAVLLDLVLPDVDGREILRRFARPFSALPIIVITGQQDSRAAVECMKLGAFDYFTKPFVVEEVVVSALRAARLARIRARQGTVLVVGGDRGEAATLRVLLDGVVPLSSVPSVQDALEVIPTCSPSLLVLFEPVSASERRALLLAVGREDPTAALLVVAAGSQSLPPSLDDTLRVAGVLRAPYRLHELVARVLHSVRVGSSRLTVAVVQAAEYVSRNYHEPCSLQDAAEFAAVSPGHLAHLFQERLGMTWRQFVARTRVELAKEHLQNPRHTLEKVAELVGFCDAPHLSRVFRRQVKQSPGQFRKVSGTMM
jgi:two-component system KDP operon response regulator KdpE